MHTLEIMRAHDLVVVMVVMGTGAASAQTLTQPPAAAAPSLGTPAAPSLGTPASPSLGTPPSSSLSSSSSTAPTLTPPPSSLTPAPPPSSLATAPPPPSTLPPPSPSPPPCFASMPNNAAVNAGVPQSSMPSTDCAGAAAAPPAAPPTQPSTLGGVTVQPNPNGTIGGLPATTP